MWLLWAAAVVLCLAAPLSWWAAWRDRAVWLAVTKPLTMLALLGAVLTTAWQGLLSLAVLVALACGLVGDVALLFGPSERGSRSWPLPAGLGAFLLGHLAYLAAVAMAPQSPAPFPAPAVVVAPVAFVVALVWGVPVARAAAGLSGAVAVYQVVLLALAVAAAARGPWLLLAGASLFVTSDLLLGRSLFLAKRLWSAPAVMSSYHLAQVLLVTGLLVRSG